MTLKEKQERKEKRYIDNLVNYKNVLEERIDFLKNYTIPIYKSQNNTSGEPIGDSSSFGSVSLNGSMPTTDQYTGPENTGYQTGMKAKLKGTDQWNDLILKYCSKHGCNPIMAKVVMATESGGNKDIGTNSYNCTGLMQLRKQDMIAMGWDWNKIVNDHEYNIECGVKWILEKEKYCRNVINNAGGNYQHWLSKGKAPKVDVHGTAWFYYGFTKAQGPLDYANHIKILYAGFGRDAHADTASQTDVLGGGSSTINTPTDSDSSAASRLRTQLRTATYSTAGNIPDFPFADKPAIDEEESLFYQKNQTNSGSLISATISNQAIIPPNEDRLVFLNNRLEALDYKNLVTAPNDIFIHQGGPIENLYDETSLQAFYLLKQKLGYSTLRIVRGFDITRQDSSHSLGIAIDLYVGTPEEAIFVADTAFSIGFRAIAIGPHFVHVDTGPACGWNYEGLPAYRGIGTLKASDIDYDTER